MGMGGVRDATRRDEQMMGGDVMGPGDGLRLEGLTERKVRRSERSVRRRGFGDSLRVLFGDDGGELQPPRLRRLAPRCRGWMPMGECATAPLAMARRSK